MQYLLTDDDDREEPVETMFPLLAAFLNDALAGEVARETAAVLADRPPWLPEQAAGPMAAAMLDLRLAAEWMALDERLRRYRGRLDDIPESVDLHDAVVAKGSWRAWNDLLQTCGRTRSLSSDTDAILDGEPETGLYYWY